ncbi:MAG: methyltransferase domain-containing protein [Candidatus Rokuibacteriota bacterium]
MRREEGAREHLDGRVAPADRNASLADIDRLSAWFGGHALTIRAVRRLLRAAPPRPGRSVVVDVGGGRGDFARRLAGTVRRRGQRIRIVILDRDLEGLGLAGAVCGVYPDIVRVCADASALPFRNAGVDVAVSSLVLHHLSPEAAVASLEAMRAAAAVGVVVNDLLRTRLSWLLVVVATRIFARHAISRHDGPLSVRRAYAPDELRLLCAKAGWGHVSIRRFPLLSRVVAVTR